MRQSFNQGTPIEEQIGRRVKIHTGHKHMDRQGPGKPRKRPDPRILPRLRRFKARVRAYWAGEVDECP